MMMRVLCLGAALALPAAMAQAQSAAAIAAAAAPVISDSRIKTLVYNPNDVYSLLTHYGYQSNIEFGARETVQTVSVGDRVAWQIIPSGRRLFIKAMEEGAHTNMTVITNKRAYQFDLRSSDRAPLHPSEELVYVVRFFYPQEQSAMGAPISAPPAPPAPMPIMQQAAPQPQPQQTMQTMPVAAASAVPSARGLPNYSYTLSGPEQVAPIRIYDDGRATFLRFRSDYAAPVQVFIPLTNGQLQPLPISRTAEGELMINTVQPRLIVRSQGQQVIVYNESAPAA